MNEVIIQDDRYPEWMKAWNSKTAEIDAQLISYVTDTTEQTSEAMDNIGAKLQSWWDAQHMDDTSKAEYDKVKADAALFKAQVENRLAHLVADGKITWAKATAKADATKADAPK